MRARPDGIAGTALFGRAPEVIASAPRPGEPDRRAHDYNDGFVLPFAIAQRTSVLLAARDDDTVRLATTRPSRCSLPSGRAAAVGAAAGHPGRLGRIPSRGLWALAGAGTASAEQTCSSMVRCGWRRAVLVGCAETATALAVATDGTAAEPASPWALSPAPAEADYAGVPCGIMDQMAALSCTEGHVLLLDTRTLETRSLPLQPAGAGLTLLVIDTTVRHSLGDTAYPERRATCQAAAAELGVPALRDIDPAKLPSALHRLADPVARRRVRHVVSENARVLRSPAFSTPTNSRRSARS
jgi:galactokinase